MHLIHYQKAFFIFLTIVQNSYASWWFLNFHSFQNWSLSSKNSNQFCLSLTFLTPEQRYYCQTNSKIFSIIKSSLNLALNECQYQFRNQRWNCTLFKEKNIFKKKFILKKTPEIAFIYALTSAAIMHSISKACSKGELDECNCDKNLFNSTISLSKRINDGFEWGGCSDNLKFGRNISMIFMDKQEMLKTQKRVIPIVNLHNNEAGRQIVERNVQLTCKCHGVSGSCTLRVCWRTLPDFRLIGSELRTKYASATQIKYNRRLNILKPSKISQKLFNITDLIYIHKSPSYCEKNFQLGSLGTQGRECNLTTNQSGSCSILCCDRGYETIISTVEEDCDCQFHWCCEVRCKRCIKKIERHFCK